jgi:hypothetical protein
MHIASGPTHGCNDISSGAWNIIGYCQMTQLRGTDVYMEEVATAFHNSAYGAAHFDTEVSENMPCHTSFLECLVAAAPGTSCDGVVRTSDTMSS